MAHFAKIVNGIVDQVIVADTKEWCESNLGGEWIQTSYNTFGGKHSLGGTPINKNYAGIGYSWDGIGFAAPQPFNSWNLNLDTYFWEPPTPMPLDEKLYEWVESDLNWQEIPSV
jgi:hypothetical protein